MARFPAAIPYARSQATTLRPKPRATDEVLKHNASCNIRGDMSATQVRERTGKGVGGWVFYQRICMQDRKTCLIGRVVYDSEMWWVMRKCFRVRSAANYQHGICECMLNTEHDM